MSEFQWTWADASLVSRGLAKASLFHWRRAKRAADVIFELQRQSLRNQRRPVRMIFKGKELRFADTKQAIVFLRPHADQDDVTIIKQRKPWENIDTLLGETLPEKSKARVRGALHCSAGHPIQKKREGSNVWFHEKRVCQVCETAIGHHTTLWRCTSGCNYNVCNHCFQSAVWNTTQIFADQELQRSMPPCSDASTSVETPDDLLSEASTSEGPASTDSNVEGAQIELQVQVGGRKEMWTFDMRPIDVQLVELCDSLVHPIMGQHPDSFSFPSKCSSGSQSVLVRTSGSEIEIIQSEMQLHSLVPESIVSVHLISALVSEYLNGVRNAAGDHVVSAIRQLLAVICASNALVEESFQQGALMMFIDLVRHGGTSAVVEYACTGLCTLLVCPFRRSEAFEQLHERWDDLGKGLVHSLLFQLFSSSAPTAINQNATLAFLLLILQAEEGEDGNSRTWKQFWEPIETCSSHIKDLAAKPSNCQWFDLTEGEEAEQEQKVEEEEQQQQGVSSVAGTMYDVSHERHECSQDTLCTHIIAASQRVGEDFQARAGRLVLHSLLQVSSPELQNRIQQEIALHAGAPSCLELSEQQSSKELLAILTSSCANAAASNVRLLQEEVQQLRHDKKFTEMLQGKLRQSCKAMSEMAHFLKVGNTKIEKILKAAICNGWESMHWSDGYTLLHFLCEYTHDTRLISLVAQLSTDLEAKDKKGDRPIDCALRNPHTHVAQCLVDLHQDRVTNGLHSIQSSVARTMECIASDLQDEKLITEACRSIFMINTDDAISHDAAPQGHVSEAPREEAENSAVEELKLGDAFMLRMQLASVTKENASLREKVSELEILRTRLAILTDEHTTSKQSCNQDEALRTGNSSLGDGNVNSLSQESVECTASVPHAQEHSSASATTTDDVKCATTEGPSSAESSPVSMTTADDKGKGKGKAKGKGKVGPSVPTEPDASLSTVKGKGKGKGGPSVPPVPGASMPTAKGKGKGKGKTAVAEARKPAMTPTQDMKTLPWKRYTLGSEIQEGTTVWDKVHNFYEAEHVLDVLPFDEIEQRFSKNASQQKVDKQEQKEKKAKIAKIDSIPQDQRFQIEVSLRTLPGSLNTGAKAVVAIQELNKAVLSPEAASSLCRFLCPSDAQVQELQTKRALGEQDYEKSLQEWSSGLLEVKPEPFRWQPVEEYMEELAQIPACAVRLKCWSFIYNLPDKLNKYHSCLDDFEQMVYCFHTSTELPFFLSLVLAFGNYLNGGKNEKRLGQADGFHVELLGRPGGLDVVNDPQGKNLRQLIFKVFFEKYPLNAQRLLFELSPMFRLVQRRIGKDKDGIPQLTKNVRVQVEDLDKHLNKLKTEFEVAHKELKDGLKLIADPAEKFVVEIPEEFERSKKYLDELVARKDVLVQQFKALLANYKAETYRGDPVIENGQMKDGNPKEEMTSEVWCQIWDDLFVAKERLLSFDEKKQKAILEPRFCKDEPISVESLEILWDLNGQRPESKPKRTRLLKRHSV